MLDGVETRLLLSMPQLLARTADYRLQMLGVARNPRGIFPYVILHPSIISSFGSFTSYHGFTVLSIIITISQKFLLLSPFAERFSQLSGL